MKREEPRRIFKFAGMADDTFYEEKNKGKCIEKIVKHDAKHIEVLLPVGLDLAGVFEMTKSNPIIL